MRGERAFALTLPDIQNGSSPHARGTRGGDQGQDDDGRFIPACAGNARMDASTCCPPTVHPRMRGERGKQINCLHTNPGSSPHARGTQQTKAGDPKLTRFIPACAGNAIVGAPGVGKSSVHPRMRGERLIPQRTSRFRIGSSPHARGTHQKRKPRTCRNRFIPACAGNAGQQSGVADEEEVHPRMRGERLISR